MISFLKTLAIILLVYFALRFLLKLITPYIIRFVARKAEEKMGQVFKGFSTDTQNYAKESEVSKKSSKVVGEYIDFEEIED